jgi:hypothetical protein
MSNIVPISRCIYDPNLPIGRNKAKAIEKNDDISITVMEGDSELEMAPPENIVNVNLPRPFRLPTRIGISFKMLRTDQNKFVGFNYGLHLTHPERVNVVLGIYKHYPASLSSLKTLHRRHFPLGGHVTTATRETTSNAGILLRCWVMFLRKN